jgi:thiamine pyrophosphate-dependent acetolactate synthase large subunit-like protein
MKICNFLSLTLKNQLVENVFYYPSACSTAIELSLDQDLIKRVIPSSDAGVPHACNGAFQASGKMHFGFVGAGPGATNAFTGIATAAKDQIPMIIFCSNIAFDTQGTNAFQDFDIAGNARSIAKASFKPRNSSDFLDYLSKAFELAQTAPFGPVVIDVARDLWDYEINDQESDNVHLNLMRFSPRMFSGQVFEQSEVSDALTQIMPKFDNVIMGNGLHKYLTAQSIHISPVITSDQFGCMGFALSAALGAAVAMPDLNHGLFIGDGDFNMSFTELLTIKRHCKNLQIIIFDNGGFGAINQCRKNRDGDASFDEYQNPNFLQLAKAFNIRSSSTDLKNIGKTIEKSMGDSLHLIVLNAQFNSFKNMVALRNKFVNTKNELLGVEKRRKIAGRIEHDDRRVAIGNRQKTS